MCASSGQNTLAQEQMQSYQEAQQMTAEEYANQQAIYAPMAKQFQSIFDMGPNQQGFNESELNMLNAQAVEGTATNYAGAAKAVNENLAAEGGGSYELPTGAQAELKQQVANSAAQTESGQETQIQEANYNQGLRNWQNAAGGLETIAAGQNPVGYENAETSAGSAAGTTEQQIANEDTSWINAAVGAGGAVAGAYFGS